MQLFCIEHKTELINGKNDAKSGIIKFWHEFLIDVFRTKIKNL